MRPPMSEETIAVRVLVIDDQDPVREAMCDMLDLEGIPFLSAEDGAAGVAFVEQHGDGIGLVILDLTMPGLSGEETFRRIRATAPGLPIIVSSGPTGPLRWHRWKTRTWPTISRSRTLSRTWSVSCAT